MILQYVFNSKLALLVVLLVLSLASLGFGLMQMHPWKSSLTKKGKLARSIFTGLAIILFIPSSLSLLVLLSSEGVKEKFTLATISFFLCLSLPIGLLSIIGSYLGYGQLDHLKRLGANKIKKSDNE